MRRPALGRDDRVVFRTGVAQDDRGGRPGDRDHEPEENAPEPVGWIPAEPRLPGARQPSDQPGPRLEAVTALEAVLLARIVWSAVARADRLGGRPRRRGHGSQRSCGAGRASTSSPATAWPHTAQNFASAASGAPHFSQETTAGVAPTGRPQFAQKCEPQTSG